MVSQGICFSPSWLYSPNSTQEFGSSAQAVWRWGQLYLTGATVSCVCGSPSASPCRWWTHKEKAPPYSFGLSPTSGAHLWAPLPDLEPVEGLGVLLPVMVFHSFIKSLSNHILMGTYWITICLAFHLGPICQGRPYQEMKLLSFGFADIELADLSLVFVYMCDMWLKVKEDEWG